MEISDSENSREISYLRQPLNSSRTTPNLQDLSNESKPNPRPRSKSEHVKLRTTRSQPSVPFSKIFVEVEDGFKKVNASALRPKSTKKDENETKLKSKGGNVFKNLAYESQSYFNQTGTLCHGFLAGIALWHCVAIFNLSPPYNTWKDFLHHYSNLAHAYQALFYFLNTFCVVSICDRFNIAAKGWETFVSLYRKRKAVLLALFFYPLSLLITVSVTNIDHLIQSHKHSNTTTWWENMAGDGINVNSKLDLWRWLSLIRGICVILGWLLIGIQSEKDLFLETLKENS